MMNKKKSYSDVICDFASFKMKECGQKPTKLELSKIRKAYMKGAFDKKNPAVKKPLIETKDVLNFKATKEFKEALNAYRSFKKANYGTSAVTLNEKNELAKKLQQRSRLNESKRSNILTEFKKYKMSNYGSRPTKKEIETLKERLQSVAELEKKINANIRETYKNFYKVKKALRENDMDAAQDAVQEAADTVDATQQMAASAPVDPAIIDTVNSLKATVDTLATQCGIEPETDFGGDANDGVPAMTGVPVETTTDQNAIDPNAPAPLPENTKDPLKAAEARIAKRNEMFKAMKESNENVSTVMADVTAIRKQVKDAGTAKTVDKKDSESQLAMPSKSELINGSKTAGKRWPTEKVNLKNSVKESLAEKMIDERIREAQEKLSFNEIIKSGILG